MSVKPLDGSAILYRDGDIYKVHFQYAIETPIVAEDLWHQLAQAWIDSKQTWLWTNDDSTMRAETENLDAGIKVFGTYTMGTPRNPDAKESFTNEMSIARYKPSEMLVEYKQKEGNSLQGGGIATVAAKKSGGSVLTWCGEYLAEKGAATRAAWYLRYWFAHLEDNVRAAEARQG